MWLYRLQYPNYALTDRAIFSEIDHLIDLKEANKTADIKKNVPQLRADTKGDTRIRKGK